MNILLTGGAGYIGSHAAIAFSEVGHQVVILDNFSNSDIGVLNRLSRILGNEIRLVVGDVRSTALLQKILVDYKIDAVIHFAGLKSVAESMAQPIGYAENNLQGAISLLRAMQITGVKHLVFSSSATVYGEPQYLPLDESHPTVAINPYGRNKLHIEEMLSDVVASDDFWRVISLRYFNPVGAHESGLIGEDSTGIPNNLMPYIAKVATGELPCLSIYGNDYPTPDGTAIRDFIHVMDLVEGHLAALEYINRYSGYEVINLGTGIGTSVFEMVRAYEVISNRQVNYKIMSRRQGDVASCYASVKKAQLLLGWTAKRTLTDMCTTSWRWQEVRKKGLE